MEINLLGRLEIRYDGTLLTPSAPKLRTVLSLLVVRANSVVRTDQIIDELWEDNPPVSVTTTLQTYIYQLRKLLRLAVARGARPIDQSTAALHTSPYGYVLTLPEGTLDSQCFEQLIDRGRAELESGDTRAAAKTLSRALRLWRGQPLVDVSCGPVLKAEVLRLEELHKNALEWRFEADLRLGRHHEILGELTGLAAQQPTHEGFQAKLMLALYRAGRRSEALNVYQRARCALATELGLDPASELQQLHRAVLAADVSLDAPPSAETVQCSKRSGPPRQLPPEGPELVGRERQEAEALEALADGHHHSPSMVLMVGPPGSGKSALCTRVGHLASQRYPDGQLYASLLDASGRPVDPSDVLAEFLRSVGMPDEQLPASTGERCRLFRTWTADRRVLVTLEDAVSMGQLLPLVPASGDCGLLVTGRRRLSAPAVTATVELSPLSVEDGVRLLTNVLGEDRLAREQSAVRELVRLCDGLPSVLHTAAAMLKVRPHWQLARLAGWLRAELVRPTTPVHDELDLHASVERTYWLVRPAVRRAFRRLTALDVPFVSLTMAARAVETTEANAEALLEEMVEFQLIQAQPGESPGVAHYRFLPLLREVGRQLPADEGARPFERPPVCAPAKHIPGEEFRVGYEPVW